MNDLFAGQAGAERRLRNAMKTIEELREELSMKTLENLKGASVLDDKNEELAALRAENAALRERLEQLVELANKYAECSAGEVQEDE